MSKHSGSVGCISDRNRKRFKFLKNIGAFERRTKGVCSTASQVLLPWPIIKCVTDQTQQRFFLNLLMIFVGVKRGQKGCLREQALQYHKKNEPECFHWSLHTY